MTIGTIRDVAKVKMRGNRLTLTTGYVLFLFIWAIMGLILINLIGFGTVFSFLNIAVEGITGFYLSYLIFPLLLIPLFLLGDVFHMSYRWFGLDVVLTEGPLEFKGIFQGFTKENRKPFFSLLGLRAILIIAWSLLFIIPGIWKAYLYSQAPNILKKDPSLRSMEALKKSEKEMKGNIHKYVILQLTFAPWYVLPLVLVGLFIWPNYQAAISMGGDGAGVIIGMVSAMVLLVGLILLLISLYVEPHKMVAKQVFFNELNKPQDDGPYDSFERELLKKQGLDKRDVPAHPRY